MISIAIVNYRSRQYLGECLASLDQYHSSDEIECIILDNNSGEELDDLVLPYSWARVVYHNQNAGFGAGMNRAFQEIQGEWMVCLNPDLEVYGSFTELLNSQLTDVSVVGIALRNASGELQAYHTGAFLHPADILLGRAQRNWQDYSLTLKSGTQVDWSSGGALAIRREVFAAVDGFDERFFMYYEDMDLCYRIQEAGFGRVTWSPTPEIHHREGGSQPNKARMKQRFYRSQRQYLAKRGWRILSVIIWPVHLMYIMFYKGRNLKI